MDMLVEALLSLKDKGEVYQFLEDICTRREMHDLAQRLEVAIMLREKRTYAEIVEKTGTSTATIGRVNRELNFGAGGYALALERIIKDE